MYYTVTKTTMHFLNIITLKQIKYNYAIHCKFSLIAKGIIELYVLLRNLNEDQWEDRKQWSLGVGQRRKTF